MKLLLFSFLLGLKIRSTVSLTNRLGTFGSRKPNSFRLLTTTAIQKNIPEPYPLYANFSVWPCGDELDKKIVKLAIPAMINFAITPLVGAVDTFWVGRMANSLALAGQAAANQIFSASFYIISFLPSVITPLIAESHGSNDKAQLRTRVGEAIFVGLVLGLIGTFLLYSFPEKALLTVLPIASPARQYAQPYLTIRAVTFLAALLANVCFATFRGTLDFFTPLKITVISNLVNVILDPLLIFPMKMGVAGAAAATCVSEIIAICLYYFEMTKRDTLRISQVLKLHKFSALGPLVLGGFTIQMRALALNIAFLAVQRTTQSLDRTGTAAAAHAIATQFWQLGGIMLLAMSTVASTLIPTVVAQAKSTPLPELTAGLEVLPQEDNRLLPVKQIADRLMLWGVLMGFTLASLQLLCLPLLKLFSPLPEVTAAARIPSIFGALLNFINGVVFIGEGIQLGNRKFGALGVTTTIGAICMMISLKFFGKSLAGVYGSIAVLNGIRLIGVLRHHFFVSPFSPTKIIPKNVD